jgi:hypothetical protein
MPVIPVLGRLRQRIAGSKSRGYLVRPCFKKKIKTKQPHNDDQS